ncbi:MAG: hypothetical protein RJA07_2338 [Bacteroidota bacterium]|jgi:hypothetical protein
MKKNIFFFVYFSFLFLISCQQKKDAKWYESFESTNDHLHQILANATPDSIAIVYKEILDNKNATSALKKEIDSIHNEFISVDLEIKLIPIEFDSISNPQNNFKVITNHQTNLILMESYFQKMKSKIPSESIVNTNFRDNDWIKNNFTVPNSVVISLLNYYDLQLRKITLKYLKTKINQK